MTSTTESAAARYRGVETWPTDEIVMTIIEGQLGAIAAVQGQAGALSRAVDAAAARLERGGRLLYLGAGTSGRLAALDAAELPPTFSWPRERAVALMAGGPGAFTNAVEGAEDDAKAAAQEMDQLGLGADDVVIGVAASGRTPYVVGGLDHARAKGALTIAVVNNPTSAVGRAAEIEIAAATGAEVLAGSTRLKAGTAQKAVLNTLSTAVMLRLGYVYRGRMVEMKPSNAKLRERAAEMVAHLADVTPEEAQRTLDAADQSIKLAVVMLSRDLSRAEGEAALQRANGRLHLALTEGA
ncbi:N-acetylmuramic acid 6-phosphate etherase [Oceaniglobus trochenteri]|uniref:N-acetylmuramic acid 6-phosphate etherase n=1 Tax=Oceaniglobus trochenteri TaxID=2763260 RepID=UPI001CFFFE70|nr:N-acetylmuramic acid 6-phosphate etherase [Oceaniglobus trochenteri]